MRSSLFSIVSAALNFGSSVGSITHDVALPSIGINDVKLSETNYPPISIPETLRSTLDTIRKVETMPTCPRMAHSELIKTALETDASNSDGKSPHVHEVMESSRSLFAARLAVCELHEAKAVIPSECKSFLPALKAPKKRTYWLSRDRDTDPVETFADYDEVTEAGLEQCRSALYDLDNGQGWMSYSNNLQNAMTYFHAVRGSIEKDEQVRLFRVLVNSAGNVSDILSSLHKQGEEIVRTYHDLTTGMRQFSVDLHQGNAERQQAVMQQWDDWAMQFHTRIHEASGSFKDLADNIDLTSARYQATGSDIQHSLDRASTGASQLALTQEQANSQLEHLFQALQYLEVYQLDRMANTVGQITSNLDAANQLASTNLDNATDLALVLEAADELLAARLAQLDEMHKRINQTAAEADRLHSRIEWFTGLFGGDWQQAVLLTGTFLSALAVFALLAYAASTRLMSLPISGNFCVALASGLVLALLATSLVGSSDTRSTVTHVAFSVPWLTCIAVIIVVYLIGCMFPIMDLRLLGRRTTRPTHHLQINNPMHFQRRANSKKWLV